MGLWTVASLRGFLPKGLGRSGVSLLLSGMSSCIASGLSGSLNSCSDSVSEAGGVSGYLLSVSLNNPSRTKCGGRYWNSEWSCLSLHL